MAERLNKLTACIISNASQKIIKKVDTHDRRVDPNSVDDLLYIVNNFFIGWGKAQLGDGVAFDLFCNWRHLSWRRDWRLVISGRKVFVRSHRMRCRWWEASPDENPSVIILIFSTDLYNWLLLKHQAQNDQGRANRNSRVHQREHRNDTYLCRTNCIPRKQIWG